MCCQRGDGTIPAVGFGRAGEEAIFTFFFSILTFTLDAVLFI